MCAQALSVTLDVHREETPRCFSSCGKPCSSSLSLHSPVFLLLKGLILMPPGSPIRWPCLISVATILIQVLSMHMVGSSLGCVALYQRFSNFAVLESPEAFCSLDEVQELCGILVFLMNEFRFPFSYLRMNMGWSGFTGRYMSKHLPQSWDVVTTVFILTHRKLKA